MYVDKFDELESSGCNQIWPSIVEAVSSPGPEKTLKQCKVKIRNMKDAYKKCKDDNKKSGNKSSKCPFYDEFDKLLSEMWLIYQNLWKLVPQKAKVMM